MDKVKKTEIYVGLNDSETYEQRFITDKYLSILKNVCKNYGVAFSVSTINGGYFHENGTYVEENSLVLTLLDTPSETISEIAKDLCVFFNQESVLLTESAAEVRYISEKL